jgi:uncharacterized protein YicC (UPF0701 family)
VSRIATRAVLAAVLVLAVACGGDDGGGDAELTQAQVIERGDDICREAQSRVDDLDALNQDPFAADTDREAFVDAIDEATEATRDALDELRQLDGPDDLDELLSEIYELREEALADIQEAKAAVEDDDQETAVERFEAGGAKMEEADTLANEAGFEVCGSPTG